MRVQDSRALPADANHRAAYDPVGPVRVRPLVRIFEREPDLLTGVAPDLVGRLTRHVTVEQEEVPIGNWRPSGDLCDERHLGLLVLEGLLSRESRVLGRRAAELLGSGDLVRPSQPAPITSVPQEGGWQALSPLKLAVLDFEFQTTIAHWPPITTALAARAVERSRRAVAQLAIARIHGLPTRLHVLFWFLADRWGRRAGGQVTLCLRLSHALLGQLVAAERPPVTTALTELANRGLVVKQGHSHWTLHGPPPTEARQLVALPALT